jgi:hypothetical protein
MAELSAPPVRLAVRGLRSRFGGPFSFALHAGECVAIQGPSGAGKSVLLRMLADLDPHEGEAVLDGRASHAMPAPEWRARVVYQAAEPAWWEATAGEHFTDGGPRLRRQRTGRARPRPRGAGHRHRTPVHRRAPAPGPGALAGAPSRRVLLLDEPTAALDPGSVAKAEALLAPPGARHGAADRDPLGRTGANAWRSASSTSKGH